MFQLGQQKFCLAVIVVKIMGNRFGRLLKFEHREIKGALVFGKVDLQRIVDAEMIMQLPVYLPAKLVIPRSGNNAQQVCAVKEVLYELILVQF
jgi:uncharacterized protein YqgQ